MGTQIHPSLYQVNTRVCLTELSRALGRPTTLGDIPDAELDRWQGMGFDWIWLLSVWRTGEAGKKVSRENPEWRAEFMHTLPDLREEDIGGSGFAIAGYEVSPDLGGDAALARLRQRLKERGLKLMLDFVPNHVALDHPWTISHPEYFVTDSTGCPEHGRDPNYPGWPDTLQLDYANPALQEAMIQELERIANQCDGVRCDMAMLVLPEVFGRTWGRKSVPFWPVAIPRVRKSHPDFCFMAEVYWDLEWTLQQRGFDFTYDKHLYDRLRATTAESVRGHLCADLDYQGKLARFLENHDEPRAATTFDPAVHRAAAVIAYTVPGLRFFHQGQFEGRKIKVSPHLVRAPEEPSDVELGDFYARLLSVLRNPAVKNGMWERIELQPAWEGNGTSEAFIAHAWKGPGGERMLVAVNYAPHPSQCYLPLQYLETRNHVVRFRDLLGPAIYDRVGNILLFQGLYLDLQPWSYHIFMLEVLP